MKFLSWTILLIAMSAPAQSKHRVVVEICSSGRQQFATAINNVENLQRAFLGDHLEVQMICHGDGIDMVLSHDNSLSARIQKLAKSGVKFAACGNTLKNRKIARNRIFSFVSVVDSGTAEVIRLEESGWSYLRR